MQPVWLLPGRRPAGQDTSVPTACTSDVAQHTQSSREYCNLKCACKLYTGAITLPVLLCQHINTCFWRTLVQSKQDPAALKPRAQAAPYGPLGRQWSCTQMAAAIDAAKQLRKLTLSDTVRHTRSKYNTDDNGCDAHKHFDSPGTVEYARSDSINSNGPLCY